MLSEIRLLLYAVDFYRIGIGQFPFMSETLIICRSLSGLSSIKKIRCRMPVVLASNDLVVQEAARGLPCITHVVFIEQMQSVWVVAADVRKVIGEIDEWLCSLDHRVPKEALRWGTHVEGGITSQRVQDLLLLIRSYLFLFSKFTISEVHCIADSSAVWEDEVLKACCLAKGLPFFRHVTAWMPFFRVWLKRSLFPFAKAGYFLAHEFVRGGGKICCSKMRADLNGAVIFQLNSSLNKHVENVKSIMVALSKQGMKAIALCWSAGERIGSLSGHEQLRAAGIRSIAVENFVSTGLMLHSIAKAFGCAIKAWKWQGLLSPLIYRGVDLKPLLNESFMYFFVAVLPQRIRYARALSLCLLNDQPAAIKPWGGTSLFEGKYGLHYLLPGDRIKRPKFINYWVGAVVPEWPYAQRSYTPDLFLAKSIFEARLAKSEYDIPDGNIEIVGNDRFGSLNRILGRNDPEICRRFLSLPVSGKLYIGLDPGKALRGYQSLQEQTELMIASMNAAKRCSGLIVAIKPHPSYSVKHLLPLIKSYNCQNVVVLPHSASVAHFINGVDLLITKYSTLILEAALAGVCSIAALLDGEERFRIFGELAEVVWSGKELEHLLIRLSNEKGFCENWFSARIKVLNEQMAMYYSNVGDSASVSAACIRKNIGFPHN